MTGKFLSENHGRLRRQSDRTSVLDLAPNVESRGHEERFLCRSQIVIRRKYRFLVQLTLVCDILVVAVSYFAAYEATAIWHSGLFQPLRNYMWILALIGPFWIIALWKSGLYDFCAYHR